MSDNELHAETDSPLPRSPEMMRACDTALLVVDVQQRFMPAMPDADRIVWNCRRLMDAARVLGVRTAVTEQNPEKLGPTVPLLAERAVGDVPAKMAFSCGACGQVFGAWQAAGVERVLLCGIEAHVCIQQTALDLLAAGYRVYIAADAVGSRGARDYEFAMRRMESSGAVLTTTEAAMFEWCEQSGTPEFRQISTLAKETPPAPAARAAE